MADFTIKRHDTSPGFRTTLEQLNSENSKLEAIDFLKVKKIICLIKPPSSVTKEILCQGWEGRTVTQSTGSHRGQVAVYFRKETNNEIGTYNVEFEAEWEEIEVEYETGKKEKVPQIQTIPNSVYRTYEVIADLGYN